MSEAQDLVSTLNTRLYESPRFKDGPEMAFSYATSGYWESISLGAFGINYPLWDSENSYLEYLRDEEEEETDVQETLEAHVIRQLEVTIKNLEQIIEATRPEPALTRVQAAKRAVEGGI